jgi:oligosaccharide repeat unit polymerase
LPDGFGRWTGRAPEGFAVTTLAAVAFLVLTLANVGVGRSLLYPPAVFTAAWTGYLLWLSILGDRFFPLSPKSLGIFLIGGLSFSLGGLLVCLYRGRRQGGVVLTSRPERVVNRLLDIGFWLCAAVFPLRLTRLRELASAAAGTSFLSPVFWVTVRRESIAEADENRLSGHTLTDNIVLLASFLALAALAHDVSRKRLRPRTVALILLALVYNVMTAGRESSVILLIGLAAAAWMAAHRIPWRALALSLLGIVLVFSLGAIFVAKGGDVTASAAENVHGIWESVEFYSLGGLVAFDHTVREPGDIPAAWSVSRSFVQVANKLGARFDLPSLHAEFSQISDHEWQNLYTMYFAYFPHFGWLGIFAFPFVLGIILSWLFRSAQTGDLRACLVYSAMVGGLVLSAQNEQFYMNVTFLLKAALFSWLLYGFRRSGVAPGEPEPVTGRCHE